MSGKGTREEGQDEKKVREGRMEAAGMGAAHSIQTAFTARQAAPAQPKDTQHRPIAPLVSKKAVQKAS